MNNKEASRIVTEFMWGKLEYTSVSCFVTSACGTRVQVDEPNYVSLDNLVAPIQRLQKEFVGVPHYHSILNTSDMTIRYKASIEWVGKDRELLDGDFNTPQDALVIATAKTIEGKK